MSPRARSKSTWPEHDDAGEVYADDVPPSAKGRLSAAGSLAQELFDKGYHPVMLFGTRASGKTSLLASLFYYLQTDPDSPAFAVQGEWIVPIDTPYGKNAAEQAEYFLNHVVHDYHDGTAATRTLAEEPFYIPIVLRPNNGQPEVKIAFLESRGEWYAINRDSKDRFPKLRAEVAEVYERFPNPISLLLIAPFVLGHAYDENARSESEALEIRDSDTALFGALQAYQRARSHRSSDKYLFVLTKWDAYTRSLIDPNFAKPPSAMVAKLIAERFPKSWTLFQTMQSGRVEWMQYSAGVMEGNVRVSTPPHLKPVVDKFPKMLWRWLYSNASQGLPLWVEEVDEDQPPAGLFRRFLDWLRKLFS